MSLLFTVHFKKKSYFGKNRIKHLKGPWKIIWLLTKEHPQALPQISTHRHSLPQRPLPITEHGRATRARPCAPCQDSSLPLAPEFPFMLAKTTYQSQHTNPPPCPASSSLFYFRDQILCLLTFPPPFIFHRHYAPFPTKHHEVLPLSPQLFPNGL